MDCRKERVGIRGLRVELVQGECATRAARREEQRYRWVDLQ